MHILLIHQAFAALDEPGGTRHHELSRQLAESGHRITIITSPVSYLTGQVHNEQVPLGQGADDGTGIRLLRAYTYPALHRSFVHRVFSFLSFMLSSFAVGLNVREVDLVWGTSPPIFQGVTAWALARLKRVSFLFEVRDLWPAFAIAVGVLRHPVLIRASQWLERFLYRHADLVMVNSPGFVDHVQERGARRVRLLPNGADTRMFDPDAEGGEFRRQHGLEGKFVALYAGAHGLSNDLGVVLRAADHLRQVPEIAFVLLGDGKDKPALMAQAAKMKLSNVWFLPPVPKRAMPQALAAADACIAILKDVPLYATVYPNKVFDYMAAGRPVVLAIEGVIKDVIEAAGAGIPVRPGESAALADAVWTLSQDRQRRKEMGRSGRRHVKANFDRTIIAQKFEAILEELRDGESRVD